MKLETVLFYVVLFQAVALLLALCFRKGKNSKANRILAVNVALVIYMTVLRFLYFKGILDNFPLLVLTVYPTVFLMPPLFYFYVKALTDHEFEFRKQDLIHVVPSFFGLLFSIYTIFTISYRSLFLGISLKQAILYLQLASLIAYLPFSFLLIRKYEKSLKDGFSNIEKLKLNWLKLLYLFVVVDVCVTFFRRVIDTTAEYQFLVFLSDAVLFYVLCTFALFHSDVLTLSDQLKEDIRSIGLKKKLNDMEIERYKERIERFLLESQAYKNSDFKILDLAKATKIPIYHLSHIINKGFGKNFFKLVNGYRIEEAKRKLVNSEGRGQNILDIAYDVGFNSKSSFNTEFKEQTGLTPSDFRRLSVASG